MKLILMAYTAWGIKSLKALIDSNHEILHVYTHPMDLDKNETVWFDSLMGECQKHNIICEERIKFNEEDEVFIKKLNPDVILSLNWRRLIPDSIYKIPKHGTINTHAGFLPKYRGFAPINWALINGESEIAVTAHYIEEEADTGDILLQKKIQVSLEDTATDVYNKALEIVPELLIETLNQIETGELKPISQKNVKGFLCIKRFPEDGRIVWDEDRLKVYNLIRALSSPFPNAFCFYNSEKLFIKKASLLDEDFRGPPGRICALRDDGIIVTCGRDHTKNQALLIKEIAIGENICNPKEFFNKLWIKLD